MPNPIQWKNQATPNFRGAALANASAGNMFSNAFRQMANPFNEYASRNREEFKQRAIDAENSLKAGILGYDNLADLQTNKQDLINPNGTPNLALTNAFNTRVGELTPAEKEYEFKKLLIGNDQEQNVAFDPSTGGYNLLGAPNDSSSGINITNNAGGGAVPHATPLTEPEKITHNIPVADNAYWNPKTGIPEVQKRTTSTQAQTDSALYGNRLDQGNSDFAELENQGFDPTSVMTNSVDNFLINNGGDIGNFLADEDAQAYKQIQNNWASANLRDESGAVLAKHEMEDEVTKYWPQPGDKPTVVKNKKRLRAIVERGMRGKAGGIPSSINNQDEVPVVKDNQYHYSSPEVAEERRQQLLQKSGVR